MKRIFALLLLALTLVQPVQAQSHLYIGIEDVALTAGQRQTLIDGLQQLGRKNNSPWPHLRNHWRIRPDNKAIILEAEWDDATVTPDAIKTRLVNVLGVAPSAVSYTTAQTQYGPTITFKQNSTTRLRMIVFGGLQADWEASRQAAVQYVKDNQAQWEPAP